MPRASIPADTRTGARLFCSATDSSPSSIRRRRFMPLPFNSSEESGLPFIGFTTRWYVEVLSNAVPLDAL